MDESGLGLGAEFGVFVLRHGPAGMSSNSAAQSYWRGEMTGVWVAAALLFGAVLLILMIAMRS
jgi:hypothetical protein